MNLVTTKRHFSPLSWMLESIKGLKLGILKPFWISICSFFCAIILSVDYLPTLIRWPLAFILLFVFPGIVLNKSLNSIFQSEKANVYSVTVVAVLSTVTLNLTILLLNYSPFAFTTNVFVRLLALVIICLDSTSYLLSRVPKSKSPQVERREDQPSLISSKNSRKQVAVLIRNLLIIPLVALPFICLNLFLSLIGIPLHLSSQLGSAIVSIAYALGVGIPFTAIFWYFIVDPTLSSYDGVGSNIFKKISSRVDLRFELIGSLFVGIVVAVIAAIPMIMQFLPPGFDTGKYLLELDGIFMDHFSFPFALPGRMRAVRPITYLNLAAIRLGFGVDALMAQRIYVVVWYSLVAVGIYGLIKRYENNRVAIMSSITWAMLLPSLELVGGGINAQLAGMIIIFPMVELLFGVFKSKATFVKFVLLGVFLILASDLLTFFYLELMVALSTLLLINIILNGTLKSGIKKTVSFFVLGVSPLIIMLPYLWEYTKLYISVFHSSLSSATGVQNVNALNYLTKTYWMLVFPDGWFGPLILLAIIMFCSYLFFARSERKREDSPLPTITIVCMVLALVHWLSPLIFLVPTSEPIRFLELATFPVSFFVAKLLFGVSTPKGKFLIQLKIHHRNIKTLKIRVPHISIARYLVACVLMAFMITSSLQFALGINPNTFTTYQAQAAVPFPERKSYFDAILWMRDNLSSGVVLTDFATGSWYPALLGNFTVGILDPLAYGRGVVTLWHKQPYWDTKLTMKSYNGYLSISYLSELHEKLKALGLDDDPIYLLITPYFNTNFPSMGGYDFDNLSYLQRIYLSDIDYWVAVYEVSSDIFHYELMKVKVEIDGVISYQQLEFDYINYSWALNLTGGSNYNITELPVDLSYNYVTPSPTVLDVDANSFISFTSTPDITYRVTFENIILLGDLVWKDDSFASLKPGSGYFHQVEWIYYVGGNASTDGDVINVTMTKKDYAGIELNLRARGINVTGASYLVLKYKAPSTNRAYFSVELIGSNRKLLASKSLSSSDEFTVINIPLTATTASRLCWIRFIIDSTHVQSKSVYFIDYVAFEK